MFEYKEDALHEECGVFGIYTTKPTDVSRLTYYGLYSLQHRGQESAGIVTANNNELKLHKAMGLVSEAFTETILDDLTGHAAIGHNRYSTTGSSNITNAQPILGQSKLGQVAIAHNGNLINADIIRDLLEDAGGIFQTTNDSEVVLNLISRGAKYGLKRSLIDAVQTIQGSFAIVFLTKDSLVGVRDHHGIRPLCIGTIDGGYILASESCALDAAGAKFLRDVEPGEIVIINSDGIESIRETERTRSNTCSFEYIYFSRPDSAIDGISVYKMRQEAGRILYKESAVDADIVSGVPDSGIVAAEGWSDASGIPYAQTLIKNKYVGRSFIAPSQALREKAVHVKLNALKTNVEGKRIILIDDSIVRGTTSRKLVTMLRDAGAKEIHFRVASPPVQFPCYFGIDIPTRKELVGATMSIDEICKMLGADSLAYLSVEGLQRSISNERHYCTGCFTSTYPLSAMIEKSKYVMES